VKAGDGVDGVVHVAVAVNDNVNVNVVIFPGRTRGDVR
jgi:hypothetical protein